MLNFESGIWEPRKSKKSDKSESSKHLGNTQEKGLVLSVQSPKVTEIFDLNDFEVDVNIFSAKVLPVAYLRVMHEGSEGSGLSKAESEQMYLDSRLLIFHALCDLIDILKSPEWVYGRSEEVLELFSKHGTEKLAAHAVFGMFQTFQQILTYGEGWENLYALLPLTSALDLNNQSAFYLQFLWHQIQQQLVFISGGVATTTLAERVRHHGNTRDSV